MVFTSFLFFSSFFGETIRCFNNVLIVEYECLDFRRSTMTWNTFTEAANTYEKLCSCFIFTKNFRKKEGYVREKTADSWLFNDSKSPF